MGAFLVLLPMILHILTALPSLIQTAEVAFSHKDKSGAGKKQLVMATVGAGIAAASDFGVHELTPEVNRAILDMADKATDALVGVFNVMDAFTSKPAPTLLLMQSPPAPAPAAIVHHAGAGTDAPQS